jgi:hypothetical protein
MAYTGFSLVYMGNLSVKNPFLLLVPTVYSLSPVSALIYRGCLLVKP